MKSITIHAIDDSLGHLIREKAHEEGRSLNQTIKKLLRESLGSQKLKNRKNGNDFNPFYGVWTKKDESRFHKRIANSERIDSEDM